MSVKYLAAITLTAAVLGLGACRDSSSASTGDEKSARTETKTTTTTTRSRTTRGGPPSDWTPYRCGKCSCRVYMGDQAECTRPSCKHSWKDHERPKRAP